MIGVNTALDVAHQLPLCVSHGAGEQAVRDGLYNTLAMSMVPANRSCLTL